MKPPFPSPFLKKLLDDDSHSTPTITPMYKNVGHAGRQTRQARRAHSRMQDQHFGPAAPAISLIVADIVRNSRHSKPTTKAKPRHSTPKTSKNNPYFPATVSVPDGRGGIKILTFNSRQHADQAGFHWVGRKHPSR